MRNLALKNAKGRGRGRSRVAAFAEEGRKSIQQVPLREIKLHVTQPKEYISGSVTKFRLVADDKSSNEHDAYIANFNAPERK